MINLAYIGPEHILHLRRDMLLFFKYAFDDFCDVSITYNSLIEDRVNILFGTTELSPNMMQKVLETDSRYIVFDLEVVTGQTINYRDNFSMSDYLDLLKGAELVLTGLEGNRKYWASKGIYSVLFQPAYTEKLEEIEHKRKDIDIFFFGIMSEYRKKILDSLVSEGFHVEVQGYSASPYFLRNSFIERSKIIANITQDSRYDHINGLRALYLAINGCCTVSEKKSRITNGFDKLQFTAKDLIKDCRDIIENKKYLKMGEEFKEISKTFISDPEWVLEYLESPVRKTG